MEIVLTLELTMKCYACRNKSNYCCCEEPNFVLNVFSLILAKQAETHIYLTFKDIETLAHFLDLLPAEIDATMEFMKKFGDFKIINESMVGQKSYERKRIFSYFNRLISKKAVYGMFQCKKEKQVNPDEDMLPQFMKKDSSNNYLFGNGIIKMKEGDSSQILSYHMLVYHSEKVAILDNIGGILNSIVKMI